MNKVTAIVVGLIIVLLIVAGFAFMQDNEPEDNTAIDTSLTENTPNDNATDENSDDETKPEDDENADEVVADVTIDLSMKSFEYSLGSIEASPGDVVRINLSAEDGTHNFVIDELDVQSKTLSSGETETLTFTIPPDAAGQTYDFYCGISDHRAMGMEGQLVISE